MKIYTQEIDIALQSPKRFWVAPHSDFKIGIKIVKNGVPVENQFNVFNGDVELTPDEGLTNGFTTFTIKSNDTGSVEYKVVVAGVGETFKITQIVTDSTVFDIDLQAPAGTATQEWVENYVTAQTSTFIDETALSAATSDKVTGSAIGSAPVVTNAVAVYASVWASMSASANANTLYVVLSDPS